MSSIPRIVFFGSFLEYSALILEKLITSPLVEVIGVVTTPPQLLGKDKKLTPTPVQVMAETHQIQVLSPEKLDEESLAALREKWSPVEYFVTAGYGKLLPPTWLSAPEKAALNLHFSLLPKYRGANPAEWGLLLGETEMGVTLIEMSPQFDTGTMVAQTPTSLTNGDTRETVYQALYTLGAEVLPEMLQAYHTYRITEQPPSESATRNSSGHTISWFFPPQPQAESPTPYAKRLTREDGFIPWSAITQACNGDSIDVQGFSPVMTFIANVLPQPVTASFIERATRALTGFPSVWTLVKTSRGEKRMKILRCHLESGHQLVLDQVQIEGKAPARWNEVKNVVLPQ